MAVSGHTKPGTMGHRHGGGAGATPPLAESATRPPGPPGQAPPGITPGPFPGLHRGRCAPIGARLSAAARYRCRQGKEPESLPACHADGLHSEPGFHPEARYEVKAHFDGADFETLTYRVSFGEADSGGRQALRLHAAGGDQAREDSAAGDLVLEGRTGETASGSGTRLWAGRIADSFSSDRRSGGPVGVATGDLAAFMRMRTATERMA